jgi:hypothetical protein
MSDEASERNADSFNDCFFSELADLAEAVLGKSDKAQRDEVRSRVYSGELNPSDYGSFPMLEDLYRRRLKK